MVRKLLFTTVAVLALGSVLFPLRTAVAHPLHTSLAELRYDTRTGSIQVSLRVFVDDFTRAATAFASKSPASTPVSTAARQLPIVRYALASFVVTDSRGRHIVLDSCGGKRVGDLMWLCFTGRAQPGEQLRVMSQVLFDNFKDQINIVQANVSGKTRNMLFTPGEAAKTLM